MVPIFSEYVFHLGATIPPTRKKHATVRCQTPKLICITLGQHQLTCLFSSLAEMFSFALSLKCLSPLFETKKDNSLLHLKACVGGNLGILCKTKYEAGEGHSETTVNI